MSATTAPCPDLRPRFRGVSHQWAFVLSLPAAITLALYAPSARALAAVGVYGATLATMFATSALYHRIPWTSAAPRRWMRRLDHSAIFFLIAGTCTPFCLALEDGWLPLLLVWSAAGVGVLRALLWVGAPRWVVAVLYVAVGWLLTPWMLDIGRAVGTAPLALVLAGGLLYSLGAVVYSRKWPNPAPKVFGFHEIFHLLVVVASALHFVAVALVVGAL